MLRPSHRRRDVVDSAPIDGADGTVDEIHTPTGVDAAAAQTWAERRITEAAPPAPAPGS